MQRIANDLKVLQFGVFSQSLGVFIPGKWEATHGMFHTTPYPSLHSPTGDTRCYISLPFAALRYTSLAFPTLPSSPLLFTTHAVHRPRVFMHATLRLMLKTVASSTVAGCLESMMEWTGCPVQN